MATITLEQIQQEQSRLAALVAAFVAQAARRISLPATEIELAEGEHYAGIVLDANNNAFNHLILLPGDANGLTWQDARDWAKEVGGELPTRREQSLLFANCREQFESAWYWSTEQYAGDAAFAWSQGFITGSQNTSRKTNELRARAVRKVPIE